MQILLNTIMLEPRRWSVPKSVTIPLIKLLPRIKEQGFDELEIWGYHLWNMSEDELSFLLKKLEEKNMKASSVGSYLTSQGGPERKGILDAARRYLSICKRLKSKRLRVFYGDRDFEKRLMKDNALFINVARGALVDEDALVRELERGRITAFLDVTDPEPPKAGHPFYSLPNCILTPHIAGSFGAECYRLGKATIKEIEQYLRGEPVENELSPEEFSWRA